MGEKNVISVMLIGSLLVISLVFSSVASAERIDILVDEAYQMLQENPDEIILLDVRPEPVYNSEHIPGAINIPFGVLEGRLDELDKSKSIIVVCQAGTSTLPSDILVQHGFERVYMLIGGINAWKENYSTTLPSPKPTQAPAAAIDAPPFTLTSVDGMTFSLSDYSGQVAVLTLVLTTCHLCMEEMEELVQLRQEYPDVAIISVSIDPLETDENLRNFKENYNADWLFARDTDDVTSRYQGHVLATPTVVVITPKGYISYRKVDVVPLEDLKSVVESAYLEEGELIPTETPEEEPQIPGFEGTLAIVACCALVAYRGRAKKEKVY